MSVRITDNTPLIKSEMNNKASLAIRFMLEDVQRFSTPFTPKKHGNLRSDVIKTVRGTHGKIVWDKKYAAPQEAGRINGRPIRNYTTPGTGPHFAQRAVEGVVRRSSSYFKKAGL